MVTQTMKISFFTIEKDVVVVLVARIVFQFYLGSELINLFDDESVQPP